MIQHLPILPVLLPLLAGVVLLFSAEVHRGRRALFALFATLTQLAVALLLLASVEGWIAAPWHGGGVGVYALGNWPAPYGIVLVVDHLASVMLTLTATLGLATLIYALARWERAGSHFLPLFQFLLMGLNGAFLTGDLFNLFVFFEVLLAASYGLALHASGAPRLKAGLHYVLVNLVVSLVFLIGAALIYGVTGTLNMAELALIVPRLDADTRALFELGAFLLGIVFLVKAGAWPLNFWLPSTYAAATAPVGAVFVILTKVGVYALLRFSILFGQDVAPAPFKGEWMFYGGLATIAVGTLGVLATQRLDRLAGFMVIISSGTLLSAFAFIGTTLTGPALYYLASSVLGSGAFFMLIEMVERNRTPTADLLAISSDFLYVQERDESDYPDEMAGFAIPAAMAFLGLSFVSCAIILSGLPPLSGFVAKFALLKAAIEVPPVAAAAASAAKAEAILLLAALLLAGVAGLIALSRLGIRVFWGSERPTPRLQWLEAGPVAGLLLLSFVLTIGAGPAMGFFEGAAKALHDSSAYIGVVLPGAQR